MPLLVFCVRCHWMQRQGARISMPQHLMVCQRAVSLSNPSGQQCSPSSSFPSPFWWFMSCMWCSCYDSRGTSPSRAEDSTSSCVVWLIFSFRCFFFHLRWQQESLIVTENMRFVEGVICGNSSCRVASELSHWHVETLKKNLCLDLGLAWQRLEKGSCLLPTATGSR